MELEEAIKILEDEGGSTEVDVLNYMNDIKDIAFTQVDTHKALAYVSIESILNKTEKDTKIYQAVHLIKEHMHEQYKQRYKNSIEEHKEKN